MIDYIKRTYGATSDADSSPIWITLHRLRLTSLVRPLAIVSIAVIVFGIVLLIFGKNPFTAYADVFSNTLGSSYGLSEVLVKMIPLMLCAAAVLLPARIGLVNVGGEGQIYLGAWLATWGALTFGHLPRVQALVIVIVLGFVGGGLWALLPAYLRAKGWLNEVISTLLLNYVAILFVNYFIYGVWRDPESANFPQSMKFAEATRFPMFGSTRIHFGLILALVALAVLYFVLYYTRWGYEMRAIGGNPVAAWRHGLPITRYILVSMFVAGGLAGLAGVGEIMAIQGRLRPGLSPGYGYMGFLVSWLAGHNPTAAIGMAFLLAVIALGGDTLQISQGMPFSAVNVLMALILFIVLTGFFKREK
jgi:simple sugar transport system permease protein